MLDSDVKESLGNIKAVWDRTELIIKRAERIRGQVVEPAINELRYAGRRLVDAMHLADEASAGSSARKNFDSFVQDCLFRCYCAQHDAFDASILFVQRVIKEYETEFGLSLMHKQYPWLADLKAKIMEADELIITSRSERGKRYDVYQDLADNFLPGIVGDYKKLVSNRESLKALFEEHDKENKKENGRFWTLVWVTISAAIIGGVIAAALTVCFTVEFTPTAPPSVASSPSTGG